MNSSQPWVHLRNIGGLKNNREKERERKKIIYTVSNSLSLRIKNYIDVQFSSHTYWISVSGRCILNKLPGDPIAWSGKSHWSWCGDKVPRTYHCSGCTLWHRAWELTERRGLQNWKSLLYALFRERRFCSTCLRGSIAKLTQNTTGKQTYCLGLRIKV